MSKWKENLSKISSKSERDRVAAFEAAMIAELAKGKESQSPRPSPAQPSQQAVAPSSVMPLVEVVTITVTENGKPTTYPNLASVPVGLRQRIVNEWLASRRS